jgi:hypothetical protein
MNDFTSQLIEDTMNLLIDQRVSLWVENLGDFEDCGSKENCPLEYYLMQKGVPVNGFGTRSKEGVVITTGREVVVSASGTVSFKEINRPNAGMTGALRQPLTGAVRFFPKIVDDYILNARKDQKLDWSVLCGYEIKQLWGYAMKVFKTKQGYELGAND